MTEERPAMEYDEAREHHVEVGAWLAEGQLIGSMPNDSGYGPIVISIEFVEVVVSRVHTRNGVRLDVWSAQRRSRVQLDAVIFDCLSYQPQPTFTELLTERPTA